MRLSLADIEADESLPGFMMDSRYPEWIRDTRYADITESDYTMALYDVRTGARDQRSFNQLIANRKSNNKARAKLKAARDALPDEVKAANALRARQQSQLNRLTSAVKMRTRMVAEKAAKYGANDFITANERLHLQWAQERLDAHVTAAIAAALAS